MGRAVPAAFAPGGAHGAPYDPFVFLGALCGLAREHDLVCPFLRVLRVLRGETIFIEPDDKWTAKDIT